MNYSLSLTINQRELIEEMYLAYQLEAKIKNVVLI